MKSVMRWEPRPWEGRVMSCWVQVVDMVVFRGFVEKGEGGGGGGADRWGVERGRT